MIRKFFRLGFRLGLLAGIGMALFKLIQGRRSSDLGRPSTDWAPAPAAAPVVNPYLPKTPPEPALVTPIELEEIVEKKASLRAVPDGDTPAAVTKPEPAVAPAKAPAKKAKKAPAAKTPEPSAVGPVKKVAPPKKAAAKKKAAAADAPVKQPPAAKKAAPAKKAPKKAP